MRRTIDCSHMLSMEIHVKGPQDQSPTRQFVSSFATGERIDGLVVILSQNDLIFDNMHIHFLGEQSTSIPSNTPSKAHHQVIKLVQDIDPSTLPNPKVFQKGRRYNVPFSFEVPDYLPASSCPHSAHPLIKAAHLHPPPSIGEAAIAGFGGKLRDDLAPEGCKTVYSIYAKLERPNITTGLQETIIERILKVRIKPLAGDVPLPDVPLGSLADDYSLYQEGNIQDSKSKSPTGQLALTLEQPECFWLPLRDPISLISKAVRLFFVYTPSNPQATLPVEPPDLKSLRAQIVATTLYTTKFDDTQPPPKQRNFFNRPINFRDAELPISIPSLPRLRWTRDETGVETGAGPSYTATLLVPVTLPMEKKLVPTFHSCLISRIYSLSFQLSVQGSSSTFRLRAPMQIAAERDPSALPSYNASVGVIGELNESDL